MQTATASKSTDWLGGFAAGGPRTLAALRIAAGAAALLYFRSQAGFTLPPEALRFPPPGTAWLSALPQSDLLGDMAVGIGTAATVAMIVGWRSRAMAAIAAGSVFYVGWLTTLTGKVDHAHHVLWVLVILAVSPCGNRWAVRRENARGSATWAVTAVIVLIGLMYFGPGLAKLRSAGLEWGWSENLTNLMYVHAWEKGHSVPVLAEYPTVTRFLGLGALLFELAFLPMLLVGRIRKWVWPLGLLFHFATWMLMGISFVTLQLMYVVFLPFDREVDSALPTRMQSTTIAALVSAVAILSLMGVSRAWPVASYPGFEGVGAEPLISDVQLTVGQHTTFITDSERAEQIGGPQRIRPLARAAVAADRIAELAAWLGADRLAAVIVDAETGETISITPLYP